MEVISIEDVSDVLGQVGIKARYNGLNSERKVK